jgi:hypothetical protein
MRWYVYAVHVQGKLAYIGKGTKQRYLISARRCNGIGGILQSFNSEKQALNSERRLIAQFNPPLNKTKGGEGYTRSRCLSEEAKDKRLHEQMKREHYENADKCPNYWTYLFAAGSARSELNSKGIKGDGWQEVAQERAQVDPEVAEALRRLNAWLPLKQPVLPHSITC